MNDTTEKQPDIRCTIMDAYASLGEIRNGICNVGEATFWSGTHHGVFSVHNVEIVSPSDKFDHTEFQEFTHFLSSGLKRNSFITIRIEGDSYYVYELVGLNNIATAITRERLIALLSQPTSTMEPVHGTDITPISLKSDKYEVCVYVRHGYYSYTVTEMDTAIAHGEAIMRSGVYRNAKSNGELEILAVEKVKVKGPGLESAYPAKFNRT